MTEVRRGQLRRWTTPHPSLLHALDSPFFVILEPAEQVLPGAEDDSMSWLILEDGRTDWEFERYILKNSELLDDPCNPGGGSV